MAEIKIEKKKPVWPWILVILIILAAVYFFWYNNDQNHNTNNDVMDNDTITAVDQTSIYTKNVSDSTLLYNGSYGTIYKEQAIADYLNFVDEKNSTTDRGYYRTAFSKLITATKREAEIGNVDVNANISSAMKNADMVSNHSATQNSENLKMAASDISKALKDIQQKEFNDLSNEADDVNSTVAKIDANGKPADQNGALDAFFDKAAKLLQEMNAKENDNQ